MGTAVSDTAPPETVPAANAPAANAPAATAPPLSHEPAPAAPVGPQVEVEVDEPSRRPKILVAAVAVVAVAGIGIGVAVAAGGSSRSTTSDQRPPTTDVSASVSAPTPSAPVDPAITDSVPARTMRSWVSANLSRLAVIVADPATATALRAAGFTQAMADTALSGTDWVSVNYLISVPGADTTSQTRNTLANSSARLVVFGDGVSPITVSQVFPSGAADLAARRAINLGLRMQAARQLPLNPAVRFLGTTRSIVAAGGVDLRASTVLVVLAQESTVSVRDITVDPDESRAGQPARILTVGVDDAQAAQATLAGLPPLYRPLSVVAVSPGILRLTWAPVIAPALTDG